MIYAFEGALWLHSSTGAAWVFVTVPADVSAGLKAMRGTARGWGSMRVIATIGQTRWRTSVFPHKSSGGFLLPLKADVRRAEGLSVGDMARITLELDV